MSLRPRLSLQLDFIYLRKGESKLNCSLFTPILLTCFDINTLFALPMKQSKLKICLCALGTFVLTRLYVSLVASKRRIGLTAMYRLIGRLNHPACGHCSGGRRERRSTVPPSGECKHSRRRSTRERRHYYDI